MTMPLPNCSETELEINGLFFTNWSVATLSYASFFHFVLVEISFSCNNMSLMPQTYGCLGQHVIDKFSRLMIYYVHQWTTLVLSLKPVFSTLFIWERHAVHKWIHGLFYPTEPSTESCILFRFMSVLTPSVCSLTCRYAIPNWIALKYVSGPEEEGEYKGQEPLLKHYACQEIENIAWKWRVEPCWWLF